MKEKQPTRREAIGLGLSAMVIATSCSSEGQPSSEALNSQDWLLRSDDPNLIHTVENFLLETSNTLSLLKLHNPIPNYLQQRSL
ncbi:MAG: hypothetical protein AAB553_00205 [Patescibacteria group bacterium]